MACGPERTAPTPPHLGAGGLGSALAGAGAGGRGWQECTGHSQLWALPGDGSQKAKVRVGFYLVWKVDSKLTLSLPTMVPFRLVLNLDARVASCYVWGEGGERDTGLSPPPQHPPACLPSHFSVTTWVITEHSAHDTEPEKSMQAREHALDRGSKGHTTPRNMQTQKIPADPRMPQPDGR